MDRSITCLSEILIYLSLHAVNWEEVGKEDVAMFDVLRRLKNKLHKFRSVNNFLESK